MDRSDRGFLDDALVGLLASFTDIGPKKGDLYHQPDRRRSRVLGGVVFLKEDSDRIVQALVMQCLLKAAGTSDIRSGSVRPRDLEEPRPGVLGQLSAIPALMMDHRVWR